MCKIFAHIIFLPAIPLFRPRFFQLARNLHNKKDERKL
ncbi:hypothetical protein B4135_0326 [Caldibacillus debilis]|uniref:Uncharacterized protein n=1 Tax=Caldibacillus debilis TaxID=301148 RepID=A0A150M5D7_9BACI|nr:hypothetical protein B4135_0326 [Caldibacillus debilis]